MAGTARSEPGSLHTREPGNLPGGESSESASSRERGRSVPRAFAALRRSIRFALPALTALALAAAPSRAEEARPEAEPVEIVVTGAPGSTRAPAAQSTVIQADQFAGEVRSVSCTKAGACAAGGYYADDSDQLQAFVTAP